jgi:hypothetical protein
MNPFVGEIRAFVHKNVRRRNKLQFPSANFSVRCYAKLI